MAKINRKSPNHNGLFPVRVLQYNVIAEFEKVLMSSPDPAHAYIVNQGELYHGIQYHIDDVKISETAWIRRDMIIEAPGELKEYDFIHVYENYLQFLWSVSYAVHVSIVRHPVLTGKGESEEYLNAVRVFSTGVSLLLKDYDLDRIRALPNPEDYEDILESHIGNANGIMMYAAVFILLHEAGHHHYGHTTVRISEEDSKKYEIAADDFAFEIMMTLDEKERATALLGVIVVFVSILLKDGNNGGAFHPAPLYRLENLIEKSGENDDSPIWLYAFVALYLWLSDYGMRWGKKFELISLDSQISFRDNYLRIRDFAGEISKQPVDFVSGGYFKEDDLQ